MFLNKIEDAKTISTLCGIVSTALNKDYQELYKNRIYCGNGSVTINFKKSEINQVDFFDFEAHAYKSNQDGNLVLDEENSKLITNVYNAEMCNNPNFGKEYKKALQKYSKQKNALNEKHNNLDKKIKSLSIVLENYKKEQELLKTELKNFPIINSEEDSSANDSSII